MILGDVGSEATTGVHRIVIATADPGKLEENLGIATEVVTSGPGLDGGHELRLQPSATCGVRMHLCSALDPAPDGGDVIQRIDHVMQYWTARLHARPFN